MPYRNRSKSWLRFIVGIILPAVLAITTLIGSTYLFIIPIFTESFMESKRATIKELVNVSWSIMVLYEEEERSGRMSRDEAQNKAIGEIEHLRYGDEFRDYFWISDMQPQLIMHPYSKDLIGGDLSDYEGVGGKKIFMEFIAAASESDSGYVEYVWHRKYGEDRVVPKLAYVKKFEPWGWVVGTGVFLDDVEVKTLAITRRLSQMIYLTVFCISVLLLFVVVRSMLIERRRRNAEEELRHSRVKYKTLVESAVDPIMMIHDGACIYANTGMEQLSGYIGTQLESMAPAELFSDPGKEPKKGGSSLVESVLEGTDVAGEHEAILTRRDGVRTEVTVSASRKDIGNQNVLVLTARDVSATKRIKEELDESRERYRQLINRLRIGIFRTTPGPRFRILEANPVTLKLFGLEKENELIDSDLFDHLEQDKSAPPISDSFDQHGIAKELIFPVKNRSGEAEIVSVSMIEGRDLEGRVRYCDGLIEDVSTQQKTADERERLIVELQTSLMFMNQPIGSSLGSYICCEHTTTVKEAAEMMSEKGSNAILVSNGEMMVGLVSDRLLRKRVLAKNLPDTTPVGQIMKTPLVYIDDRALIFEAAMLLQEEDINYLVVRDENDNVVSVISNEELLDVHRYSANFMIEQIRTSTSVEEIVQSHYRLPRIIKALIDSGAHARNITRIITTISDTVLERLVDMAIEEIGEPPVRFAFISVGSEGRGEQTLVTDQDNAIIFEDIEDSMAEQVHDYFHQFATMICTWLDEVGYQFCKGKIMAMTPKWCQPISVWKSYFTDWIGESTPEDLMEVSIFFDFRCLYGDQRFTSELHEHIRSRAQNQKAFLYQMAQNTLLFKVPIDFFGNLSVESNGEHVDTFNIKHVIAQIVGFARIYAIFYGLEITNTLQRINRLLETDVLKPDMHQEIVESYNFLMQLRFRHQVRRIDEGLEPDNHVHIKEISHMEKELLEKILANINLLRKRLSLVGHNEIYF
ncbi:MAG: DUF294 nucleotidyltransferase-like domain-containing protein [Desulfocapsaceae bacterium]